MKDRPDHEELVEGIESIYLEARTIHVYRDIKPEDQFINFNWRRDQQGFEEQQKADLKKSQIKLRTVDRINVKMSLVRRKYDFDSQLTVVHKKERNGDEDPKAYPIENVTVEIHRLPDNEEESESEAFLWFSEGDDPDEPVPWELQEATLGLVILLNESAFSALLERVLYGSPALFLVSIHTKAQFRYADKHYQPGGFGFPIQLHMNSSQEAWVDEITIQHDVLKTFSEAPEEEVEEWEDNFNEPASPEKVLLVRLDKLQESLDSLVKVGHWVLGFAIAWAIVSFFGS